MNVDKHFDMLLSSFNIKNNIRGTGISYTYKGKVIAKFDFTSGEFVFCEDLNGLSIDIKDFILDYINIDEDTNKEYFNKLNETERLSLVTSSTVKLKIVEGVAVCISSGMPYCINNMGALYSYFKKKRDDKNAHVNEALHKVLYGDALKAAIEERRKILEKIELLQRTIREDSSKLINNEKHITELSDNSEQEFIDFYANKNVEDVRVTNDSLKITLKGVTQTIKQYVNGEEKTFEMSTAPATFRIELRSNTLKVSSKDYIVRTELLEFIPLNIHSSCTSSGVYDTACFGSSEYALNKLLNNRKYQEVIFMLTQWMKTLREGEGYYPLHIHLLAGIALGRVHLVEGNSKKLVVSSATRELERLNKINAVDIYNDEKTVDIAETLGVNLVLEDRNDDSISFKVTR